MRLPDAVVRLIERWVPDPIARDGLLGDLEERYAQTSGLGRFRRAAWLFAEVSTVIVHYTRKRQMGMMDRLRLDVGFALRGLVLRPAFSALVVGTLALGVGANTAVYSVVRGLLFEPLPYDQAERLVLINQQTPDGFTASVSLPNYRDWKERAQAFDRFSAILPSSAPLRRPDGSRIVEVGWVHGGFFETLGIDALVGRTFGEAESEPGAERVVVLSHALWAAELGSDPAVIGTQITLRDEPWTVVGVMPPEFDPYRELLAWVPMGYIADRVAWDDRSSSGGAEIFARLRASATPEGAQSELEAIGADIASEFGDDVGYGNLQPLRRWYLGDAERQAVILMAAVALVLLVACANVANLLFVRSEKRRGEIAVRASMGASRGRLFQQMLTETLVLGVGGGLLGALLGAIGLDVLLAVSGDVLPRGFADRIRMDGGVLTFAVLVALATTLLAGLLPAMGSGRVALSSVLRDVGRKGRSRSGARSTLIAAEMALSMILLVGAGLLISSLISLQNADRGFDGSEVLTLRVQTPRGRYVEREQWDAFNQTVREQLQALPGVSATSTSNHFPLSGNSWEMLYKDEGTPPGERGESVLLTMVSPSFFETFSVDIVSGRGFDERDRRGGELVAIVDESLARTRWPGETPIGKRVTFETTPDSTGGRSDVWRTVVGVVKNVRHYELASPSRIQVYTPIDQSEAWGFSTYVALQANTAPAALAPSVRRVISRIDPEAGVYRVRTIESLVSQHLGGHRAVRELLSVFAIITLLLGCVGIYSVVSHTTAQRTQEIGVRIALGGTPATMARLVVRESLIPVLAGLAIGGASAAGLGRMLDSLLYDVQPADPVVIGLAAMGLLMVAALSAWLPARSVARVAPARALTSD